MPVTRPHKIKIVAVGDDLGFELPQEVIDRYQLREGDDIGLSWKDGELHSVVQARGHHERSRRED